ncbi:uncharacterized protein BT62DRAFT_1013251 [Guyanagaster necrorhizus]|uniref:Uncharacterized protein n=1 Tax=Guyanagaster necrorhizus TaxID=856835 RepID=A0A9P7VFD0_9AGAR|nr:uncharacterized protein BT62DRAFT_1013251 [Guyanagaster necrorhizus MCA 3950]KAG7439918.1 hypothetical protein BT62DRAFT_1013251 [Guyanagaster necrorhizus MCA 3950]
MYGVLGLDHRGAIKCAVINNVRHVSYRMNGKTTDDNVLTQCTGKREIVTVKKLRDEMRFVLDRREKGKSIRKDKMALFPGRKGNIGVSRVKLFKFDVDVNLEPAPPLDDTHAFLQHGAVVACGAHISMECITLVLSRAVATRSRLENLILLLPVSQYLVSRTGGPVTHNCRRRGTSMSLLSIKQGVDIIEVGVPLHNTGYRLLVCVLSSFEERLRHSRTSIQPDENPELFLFVLDQFSPLKSSLIVKPATKRP